MSLNFHFQASKTPRIYPKAVILTKRYSVASQPNYVAAAGGSTHGIDSDDFSRISSSSKTIVDLLEAGGVSWSEYEEDSPYSGFEANWINQKTGANDYVRKHKYVIASLAELS
jgi:hypothetical protein